MSQTMIEGYRLSPQQRRVWTAGLSDHAASCVVQIKGELDTARLREAIREVVARHEILRTTFKLLPGMTLPVQVISDSSDFDPPVLRVDLVPRSKDEHVLSISLPVLCADQESLQRLVGQIAAAYTSSSQTKSEALQYADYAEWRNELLESEAGAAGRRYWRQQDLSEVDRQKLPFEKRADGSFQRAVQTVEISAAAGERIRTIADRTFALACWQLLISRLTGNSNVVVGVACDGRKFAELEEAIGLFSSFVPVRSEISPDLPFEKFLQQTGAQEGEARRWQEYFAWDHFFPFCFEFHKNRNLPRSPDVEFVVYEKDACADRFKIKFVFEDHGDQYSAWLQFDASVFLGDDIRRLADQLSTLIEDASKRPEVAIGQLEILTRAERQLLLAEVNNTSRTFPTQLINELFEQQASERPDDIAVVFESEQLTYHDLNARANQLAHHLMKLGVSPDEAVGLCLERSGDLIVGLLGIMKAGGAYVPLDPGLPQVRLEMILEESGARVLVTTRRFAEFLGARVERVVDLDSHSHAIESSSNPATTIHKENLAYVIFTSGSTGRPKGVAVEHRQIVNYLNAITEKLDLPARSSFAMVSTIAADLGNTVLFPALCKGGTLHLIDEERSSDPNGLAEYFRRHQIDCLKIVPSHLSAMLSAANPKDILPRRRLVLGGEACPWSLAETIARLSPECVVFNHYGPTEATVGATTYRVSGDTSERVSETAPLGGPLANVQTYILDEALRPVPVGATGELHVGGAGLARGYINRAGATAEKFIPNPFSASGERLYKTGDRARYLNDGRIEFLGRIDNQVKIRGNRIELREIEIALRDHDEIADNVVIAREDSHGDKRLVAYLVTQERKKLSPGDLRNYLHERLPDYMAPAAFVFLDRLPLTLNGKVDRDALPEPDHSQSSERVFQAPRNEIEKTLAQIWSNVLDVEPVGVHDNFFDLGGDSILSIQIIARANQAGLALTPRQLFQHQTVAELATVAGVNVATQAEQGIVTGPVPLIPIQARFFELDQPELHHYNQSMLLEVKEPADAPVLQRAIELLLVQHDALRLRYQRTHDGWTQNIVAPDGVVPFELIDLSTLSEAEQRIAIAEHAARLHAGLDLQKGPLLRAALFDRGAQQNSYLLVVIHHLAVDGVSWRILLEDLHALYQQLSRHEELSLPPKTTSFKHWAERLTEHARSSALRTELAYWRAIGERPKAPLPLDHANGTNTVLSAKTISASLNADETRELLQSVPAAYRTQINEVLLMALVRALASWTRSEALLVDLEGHGREEILEGVDLSRTVGWFTTIFPVVLDCKESQKPLEVLRSVKEQVRMIPNRGIGYGLLKYTSDDGDELRILPQAEVRFNYLGQVDRVLLDSSTFAMAPFQTGPTQSLKAQRAYLLNIIASVTGGELRLDWTYSENIHRSDTIKQLAQRYLEELRALVEQSRRGEEKVYSPSDFPSANISQEELSKVLAKLRG